MIAQLLLITSAIAGGGFVVGIVYIVIESIIYNRGRKKWTKH